MPLYEYECDTCGHRFEVIQKSADSPVGKCPKCGGEVHKLQSAPAFQFKGSGWYVTDYARKDQSASNEKSDKSEASSGEGAKSEGAKTDGAKSETKESSAKADKGTDTTKSTAKTDT